LIFIVFLICIYSVQVHGGYWSDVWWFYPQINVHVGTVVLSPHL
jgi:hypothetical protein